MQRKREGNSYISASASSYMEKFPRLSKFRDGTTEVYLFARGAAMLIIPLDMQP